MWRIGELARMAGVSERTLRHYDRIGLLAPAAVSRETGYRWYGAAELARLERIRGLQDLGLSLRRIAEIADAPESQLRDLLGETIEDLRRDIAAKTAALAAAEDRLASASSILPQQTAVGERRLRLRTVHIDHPADLAAVCGPDPTALLTWLTRAPDGAFTAAHADDAGDPLILPPRRVVRAVVPPGIGLVPAGRELFAWLDRRRLAVAGPTLEEHLADADGSRVTVLEVPVAPNRAETQAGPAGRPAGPASPEGVRDTA
ncbi:MerR family transcriptional regulator [Glycomyces terrestris]|uniref:MerR family transcriptional regulator n=1 Tax=Glycomyces terrestris TaxID=2493553 RepID=A0A426UT19_9ACTN|nr:MerR family transcriptional regulator [Glycomyces terrestris]RRR96859.1 MerR family transcriptional regulator [Glycomyces terrestris]